MEDEGPITMGSPLVLVEVTELFQSMLTCEYPDVEADGPRDNVIFLTSINQGDKNQTLSEEKTLHKMENPCGDSLVDRWG